MDLASLIGLIVAWVLVVITILLGGEMGMFINAPSLVSVVGGSIAARMMQFTMQQFAGALKSAGIAFMYKEITPLEVVNAVDEAAIAVRKDGLLALEPMLEAMEDEFMKEGLQMGGKLYKLL